MVNIGQSKDFQLWFDKLNFKEQAQVAARLERIKSNINLIIGGHKNEHNVSEALLQCLIEDDTESFIEILDSYLRVNRSLVAKRTDLSRSTVSLALSPRGNPTLKTIAKIVSESMRK